MDTTGSQDLLHYILSQASSGQRNWFGFQQQRVLGINLCYEIAKNHADTMTPDQITEYVIRLNNSIYTKLIKGD
jgi:hypothetical protein